MSDRGVLEIFEAKVKEDIPLANEIQFSIESYDQDSLVLSAPYLKNKNDKNTVFAGSQASLALLAGWSLVSLRFKDCGVKVVAAVNTEMHFKKPLEKDFFARACFVDEKEADNCVVQIQKKGRSRVNILVELFETDSQEIKATLKASYYTSV